MSKIKREIIKLDAHLVRDLTVNGSDDDDIYEMIDQEIKSTDKYYNFKTGVIKRNSDGLFFKIDWCSSDHDVDFDQMNGKEIKCTQVFEKEKVIKYYE